MGTPHRQATIEHAEKQQASAASGPGDKTIAEDEERFGKGAITQAYLWPRMGKWYKENDVIVSETG